MRVDSPAASRSAAGPPPSLLLIRPSLDLSRTAEDMRLFGAGQEDLGKKRPSYRTVYGGTYITNRYTPSGGGDRSPPDIGGRRRTFGMAIDYCVDYTCDAKRALGTDGLLQLCQARIAFEATQRSGTRRGEYDFWTRVVRGPEKDHVEMVTVGQLRRKSNRLVEFTSECGECPANVTGGPAGCFGRVTYPIDSSTGKHLAS